MVPLRLGTLKCACSPNLISDFIGESPILSATRIERDDERRQKPGTNSIFTGTKIEP